MWFVEILIALLLAVALAYLIVLNQAILRLREQITRLQDSIVISVPTRSQIKQEEIKKTPTFIDADDVVTQVRMEHAEKMRQLNPEQHDKS